MPTIRDFSAQEYASNTGDQRHHLLTLTIECADAIEALDAAMKIRSMLAAPTAHANAVTEARGEFASAVERAKGTPGPAPTSNFAEPESENLGSPPLPGTPDATPDDATAGGETGPKPTAAAEPTPPAETAAEPKVKRPGLDPQAALDAYAAQSEGNVAPAPTDGGDFLVGGRYEGIEIVKVQTSKAQGFGVLTLQDGQRVQYDLASGIEIARKNRPDPPEGAKDIDIIPTTRQGGPGAPKVDQPMADADTPEGETPAWMQAIIDCESLKDAIVTGLKRISAGDFVDWAVANRLKVPAFKRIQAGRFRARIERQLETLAPKKKKGPDKNGDAPESGAEASP